MASDPSLFVAGHFVAALSAGPGTSGTMTDIGFTETGWQWTRDYHLDAIKIDDLGDTVVDGIYRGGNARLSAKQVQFGAPGRAAMQHFYDQTTVGVIEGIGKTVVTGVGRKLTLTPVAGINAANKTYTFIVAPDGGHGGMNLATTNRKTDLNLLIFPQITGTGSNLQAVLFTEV